MAKSDACVLGFVEAHVPRIEAEPFTIVKKTEENEERYWLVYHCGWWVENGRRFTTLKSAVDWVLSSGNEYDRQVRNLRNIKEVE